MKITISDKIKKLLDKTNKYYNVEDNCSALCIFYINDHFTCELHKEINPKDCLSDLEIINANLQSLDGISLFECLNELNETLDDNFEDMSLKKEDQEDTIILNGKIYKFTGEHK